MIALFVVVAILGLLAAFALTPRDWRVWHTGVHTEYAGPGRVWFVSFFRGAGYVVVLRAGRGRDGLPLAAPGWRPNIEIRGFTIRVRTHATRFGKQVPRVRVTADGNQRVF